MKSEVICCFCGESLSLDQAGVLIALPNIDSDEKQQLFCHKNHFVESLIKTIPLHPDFLK